MKLIKVFILCAAALVAVPALAQDKPSDTNMQILLDKVKADKKLVVAANMDLNDAEGKAFWPIYEAYQKDLQAINDRLGRTILAYADAYNKNALTDEMAKQLTNEALTIDQDEITMQDIRGQAEPRVGRKEGGALPPDRKQDSGSDSV